MRNKIYIARTDALNDESVFQRLYDSASPYRRRKTERLIFRKDKMLSLAAEELLSIALADNGITDFSVVYGENGKPYLRNNELYGVVFRKLLGGGSHRFAKCLDCFQSTVELSRQLLN